jgi:transcriptional regulator with XRE-family HTH domain
MTGYKGVPTIRKRLIGGQLRRLREAQGISVEQIAGQLGVGHSTIRRQESGHTAVSVADVRAYAQLYGIEDEIVLKRLIELAKHGRVRGWWSTFSSTVGPTTVDVADAEDLAKDIRTFQPLTIPGLFQTPEYSAAVIDAFAEAELPQGAESSEDEFIVMRERRKELMNRSGAPRVWAVIGEAAIATLVGGPEVMRAQIEHLLKLAQRRNITIQLLPFSAGAYMAMSGSFVLFSFADTLDASILFCETTGGDMFNDDPDVVRPNMDRFSHLQAQALSIADTLAYLRRAVSTM